MVACTLSPHWLRRTSISVDLFDELPEGTLDPHDFDYWFAGEELGTMRLRVRATVYVDLSGPNGFRLGDASILDANGIDAIGVLNPLDDGRDRFFETIERHLNQPKLATEIGDKLAVAQRERRRAA